MALNSSFVMVCR